MDGTSGTTDIKLDFCDDIVALLDGVFMASFEAEYDAVSLFVQYEYTNIAPDAKINREFDYKVPPIGPTISIDVSTKVDVEDLQYLWEVGAGYRFWENSGTEWKLLGGVKSMDMSIKAKFKKNTVTLPGGGQIELENKKFKSEGDWWTPFLGLDFSTQLSEHWQECQCPCCRSFCSPRCP